MKKTLVFFMLFIFALFLSGCNLVDKDSVPPNKIDEPCLHEKTNILSRVEATCTEKGLTEGEKCIKCGEITKGQEVIEATGHVFENEDDKVCDVCDYLIENTPAFVVSKCNVKSGTEQVAVTVSMKNNPGITSVILKLTYDNTVLSLSDVVYNVELDGHTVYPQQRESPITLYWINGFEDMSEDAVFATIYFDIAEEAVGECDIELSYEPNNVYNYEEENIDFEIIHGNVIIE